MKTLLKIVLTLTLLVVVIAVGIAYFINTGQYRAMLERAVADNSGYELTIAGAVELDIFPTLGLTLNDVRLRNPGAAQELMSTSSVVLRLDARELLAGRLLIQELLASNFHVNYYVAADGRSIWDTPRGPATSENSNAEVRMDDAGGDLVATSFARISIENTSIDYQDLARGVRYRIDNFNLESRDTNLAGRPFAVAVDFDFENNGVGRPVPVGLRGNVIVDLGNNTLNLNNLNFNITPLLVQGDLSIANFDDNMQFTGNLRAEPFDIRGLLETLALMEPDDAMPGSSINSRPRAAFAAEFSGNQNEATIPGMVLTLGDSEINVNASVRFPTELAPANISYNLRAGDLDLTPFLAASESEATEGPEPTDMEIPVDALGAINLLGSASIDSLTVGELRFDDINVFTNIEDGVLDIEITPVSAFAGSLAGAMRLNGRAATPELEMNLSVREFNLVDLAPRVSRFDGFSGNLNVEAAHTARGASVNAMGDSLSGTTTFNVINSTADITLIKQVFTAIAALSPSGESIQQWPDVIRFNELGGYITLDAGLQANQNIKLRMDNFDVTGSGGIDLAAGTFNYDLLFTVLGAPSSPQTIRINERYHDISWPVQCSAAFADPVSRYCRPDFNQVREIFAQIGTAAVRSRLDEVITDQVPEDIGDGARGLLRNILN